MMYYSTVWKRTILHSAVILFTLVLIPEVVSANQNQNGVPTAELEISIRSNNEFRGTLRILMEDDIATPMETIVKLPFGIRDDELTVSRNVDVRAEKIEAGAFRLDILQNHTLLHVRVEDPSTREVWIKFPIDPYRYPVEEGRADFRRSTDYGLNSYLVLEERYESGTSFYTFHFRLFSPAPGSPNIIVPSKVVISWDDDIKFFEALHPNVSVNKATKRMTTPVGFFEQNTLSFIYFQKPTNTAKVFSLFSFVLMLLLVGLVPVGLVSIATDLIPSRRGRIGVSIFVWLLAMAVTIGLQTNKVIGPDQLITLLVVGVAALLLVIFFLTQQDVAISSNILQVPDSLPDSKNEDELSKLSLAELQKLDTVYAKHLSHLLGQRARQGLDVKFETEEQINHVKTERAKVQSAIDKISSGAPMADPLQA